MDQSPFSFSEAAEMLVFSAVLFGVSESDPLKILRNLPRCCLDMLHYSFLIAASDQAADDMRCMTDISCAIHRKPGTDAVLILGTGTLTAWYDAITLNLTQTDVDWSLRLTLDKVFLLLEREGLQVLFDNYAKKALPDKTFLLEHK